MPSGARGKKGGSEDLKAPPHREGGARNHALQGAIKLVIGGQVATVAGSGDRTLQRSELVEFSMQRGLEAWMEHGAGHETQPCLFGKLPVLAARA